jgi:hypothetical protein
MTGRIVPLALGCVCTCLGLDERIEIRGSLLVRFYPGTHSTPLARADASRLIYRQSRLGAAAATRRSPNSPDRIPFVTYKHGWYLFHLLSGPGAWFTLYI